MEEQLQNPVLCSPAGRAPALSELLTESGERELPLLPPRLCCTGWRGSAWEQPPSPFRL